MEWRSAKSKCLKVGSFNTCSLKSAHLQGHIEIHHFFFCHPFLLFAVLCVSLTQLSVYLPSNWGKEKAISSWQRAFFLLLSWWVGLNINIHWGKPKWDTALHMCICMIACLLSCLFAWTAYCKAHSHISHSWLSTLFSAWQESYIGRVRSYIQAVALD